MSEEQQPDMTTLYSRHQQEQQNITRDDALHVASLFQQVGNELHTVDHHSVGGNSSIKALKLEKEKVFNAPMAPSTPPMQPRPQPPPQVQAPPVQPTAEQEAEDIASAVENKQPVQVPAMKPVTNKVVSTDVEKKLKDIETKLNKLTKKPNTKFNVKFKSDSIAATAVDNFDDLVDFLRKSLNKKSKRITIVSSEN